MESLGKTSLQLYAYYERYVERISKIPLVREPLIRELELTRGAEQAAYREMGLIKFPGALVHYISWVGSIHFWNDIWAKRVVEEYGASPDETVAVKCFDQELDRHPQVAIVMVRIFGQYWIPTITIVPVVETYYHLVHRKGSKLAQIMYMHLANIKFHTMKVASGLGEVGEVGNSLDELKAMGLGRLIKYVQHNQ